MEKFRTKFLSTFYFRIFQMGEGVLTETAFYSSIVGILYQIIVGVVVLAIYQKAPFGQPISIPKEIVISQFLIQIMISISLFMKVSVFIAIALFSNLTNTLVKKIILFLVNTQDQVFIIYDSFLLGYTIGTDYKNIIFASINVLFSLIIKVTNESICCNYAFIYSYPFKKMPTLFLTMVISILQSLFVIFQLLMNNNIFTILFFATAFIKLLVEIKFFYDAPYLNTSIFYFKQVVFNNALCYTLTQAGSLLFQIVSENAVVFYIVLSLFGIVLNITSINYLKDTRLVLDIETSENWEDVNTKIQYSYQLIQSDKLDKMATISQQHLQKCKNADCRCRWKEITSPIDFRHKIFSSESEIFQIKVFLKYYLLVLCENFKTRFTEVAQAWIVYISSLSLLNLYPKLLYYTSNLQTLFANQIGFFQKIIVHFLRLQSIQFIKEKNNKDSVLQIQRIKKVQELQTSLKDSIKKLADIKQKIWLSLLESPVQQEIIELLFRSQLDQRNIILQTYYSITKIPHKKLALWRTMTVYCKNIIEDSNLQRIVRKNVSKQDLVTKNVQTMDQKQGSYPRKIQEFLDFQDNYCLMKISMNQKTLGCIQWHNQNIYNMFGYTKSKRLAGQSIDLFIPDIFKQYHSNILKEWYQYPRTHKLNRLAQTYIRTNIRQFQSVLLYVKIFTMDDEYGVFAILSQNNHQRFIVLNNNLDDIISTNFIKDKLKSLINHDDIILPILCAEYTKLKHFKQKKYQQHTLRFPILENYDQYYNKYKTLLSELDPKLPKEQLSEQRQNITTTIANSIAQINQVEWIQIDVLVKSISITNKDITSQYILIKQSIDQESYIDENQKLKKKKQNPNSTIFHPDSSLNFQMNNTRTRQKKQLDFQASQSSINSTKNQTNRDFIEKLRNKELVWLQKVFYLCLIIYFLFEIARLIQIFYFSLHFTKLLEADNSVSAFIMYLQSLYDNVLLNVYSFTNNGTGLPWDKTSYFQDLVSYNYFQLVKDLQKQSSSVSNQWMKMFISQTNIWLSTNKQYYDFPIVVWFEAWSKIATMSSIKSALSYPYAMIMTSNYPHLINVSHRSLQNYLSSGKSMTENLKYVNIAILPFNVLIIVAILFFYNKYLNQKQKIRYDFVKIFIQIDPSSIQNYANQYRQYQQNMSHIEDEYQEEKEIIHLNKKIAINKSKISPIYRLNMILIGAIIILDIVVTASTITRSDSLYEAFKSSSNIAESFMYELQSMIQLKQLAMGIKPYSSQSSLQKLNTQDFQQFKDNALKIFNQFADDSVQKSTDRIFQLLVSNLCEVLEVDLNQDLDSICKNQFSLQIIKSGMMTFSHYIVDVMLEKTQEVLSTSGADNINIFPDIMTNSSLIDGSLSLTFRLMIVEKVKNQIGEIILYYQNSIQTQTVGIVCCIIGTLIIFVGMAYFFKKKENKQWKYIYGSLLIVPEKELLKASTVSKMILQLKDKSL